LLELQASNGRNKKKSHGSNKTYTHQAAACIEPPQQPCLSCRQTMANTLSSSIKQWQHAKWQTRDHHATSSGSDQDGGHVIIMHQAVAASKKVDT